VKSAPGNMGAIMSFVSYVEGMAIPMSLIVIFCAFGKRVLDVSEIARKNLPYIKLANAALFLAFAAYMLKS
jgi:cytochrome c biogenesis protein CcdA